MVLFQFLKYRFSNFIFIFIFRPLHEFVFRTFLHLDDSAGEIILFK